MRQPSPFRGGPRIAVLATLLLVPLTLAGCEAIFGDESACTLQIEHALEVSVVDAATGEPVTGALAVARDGAFTDSARSRFLTSGEERAVALLAPERPGIYGVTVSEEGFAAWSRFGVFVEDGECHVRTVELTARLEPT